MKRANAGEPGMELASTQALPTVATPMDMLAAAVERGMDPQTLKDLMDLSERWQAGEARKAFVTALNLFKSDPPDIFKNKAVSFGGGKGGGTSYRHATLDNVSGVIGEGLAKVGISHRWETEQEEGGMIKVTCILQHSAGHSERVWLRAMPDTSGSKNSIQAVGSTVTYLQRYTLLAATGMAVQDQDDDARMGETNTMPESTKLAWLARIAECHDLNACEILWPDVARAATDAGDVPAYEELKAAMLARRRALKTA